MNNIPDSNLAGKPASITPGDIYYTLFRHKWKIVLCSFMGLVAAGTVFLFYPETYSSQARLFIRYVEQGKEQTSIGSDNQRTATLEGRGGAMGSELQIITSMDLAMKIADDIGPDIILDSPEKRHETGEAARKIQESLRVSVPGGSSVINLKFSSKNQEIVESVLSKLIDAYLTKHIEARSSGSFDSFVNIQAEQYRVRLNKTELELKAALDRVGVISLESAMSDVVSKISHIKSALLDSNAQFISRKTELEHRENQLNVGPEDSETQNEINNTPIEEGRIQYYGSLLARLDLLERKHTSLLINYQPDNALVRATRSQIEELKNERKELEDTHPELGITNQYDPASGRNSNRYSVTDYRSEQYLVAALAAKISLLENQLNELNAEAAALSEAAFEIEELNRRKAIEEQNYRYFSQERERAKIDQAFGAGRVKNIGIVQHPTPPVQNTGESKKLTIAVGFSFFGFGLAWAFLIEFYLDRSVKRPVDIKRSLNIPLFLSIPDTSSKRYRKLLRKTGNTAAIQRADRAKKNKSKTEYEPSSPALKAAAKTDPENYNNKSLINAMTTEASPLDDDHVLHPYYEALRDRMIGFFEGRGMTHKPKLIGLTGLGKAPGTTTVASGLASTLSKTGEGNVLLVDMNLGQESAQQYYQGEAVSNLDAVLENAPKEKINTGKLVVAAEGSNGYNLPKILPNRFNDLVPKLKASDFDYIIFDMPAVSPISVTPRLASFMDSVLLVIESEKATKDVVERATELLLKTNQNVGAILNKTKSYVPSNLQEEYLGDL